MSTHWHDFHLVDPSPWPLTASFGGGFITLGLVNYIHNYDLKLISIGLLIRTLTAVQWWRDIHREATFQGHHSKPVQWNIRWGMRLFIVSEVLFFFSFFWSYFHMRLSPGLELGLVWPPTGVVPFNPFRIPLLNTTILLTSGLTITWSHHRILSGDFNKSKISLLLTILLGLYFTLIQVYEYKQSSFTLSDSVYGSCFFVATGFHGLHVVIGSTFLVVTLFRILTGRFNVEHHFGFEAAAWYWHFVDVVWIFLYIRIYWWGR